MNKCEIEGFVNFFKVDTFPDGRFRYRFSITLQAGKDREGNYRKEYFDVRLSSELSQQLQFPNRDGSGCRVKVSGRIRNEPWVDKNTGQTKKSIYLEGFEGQIISYAQQQHQQPQQPQQPQQRQAAPQGQPYQQQQPQRAPAPQGQPYQQQQPQRAPAPQGQPYQQQQWQQPQMQQQQQAPQMQQQQWQQPQAPQAPQAPSFDDITF